ncbi:MAG TPA: hypothetical protein VFE58_19390 [Tepidisphaeraceae bacterium]|jgi:hypothetical protein|nr:hypothetical protein [Tepidisphaeraceae bacterium]
MKNKPRKSHPNDPNVYPPGLDYKKAKALAKYYDDRKDQDLIGDIAFPDARTLPVWVEVPQFLLPKVRKLIDKHKKSA